MCRGQLVALPLRLGERLCKCWIDWPLWVRTSPFESKGGKVRNRRSAGILALRREGPKCAVTGHSLIRARPARLDPFQSSRAPDDGSHIVRFCLSDGSIDRMGDRIDPNGWDLVAYPQEPHSSMGPQQQFAANRPDGEYLRHKRETDG